jgi:hypothetical protein
MLLDITTRRNYTAPLLVAPIVVTNFTTFASKAMDIQGARGAEIAIFSGAMVGEDGGVTNYLTPHLQESNDTVGADFTDVAFTDMLRYSQATGVDTPGFPNVGQLIGGTEAGILAWAVLRSNQIIRLGYLGTKRYLRINFVFTGTGVSSASLCAVGAVEFAKMIPALDISPITTS